MTSGFMEGLYVFAHTLVYGVYRTHHSINPENHPTNNHHSKYFRLNVKIRKISAHYRIHYQDTRYIPFVSVLSKAL